MTTLLHHMSQKEKTMSKIIKFPISGGSDPPQSTTVNNAKKRGLLAHIINACWVLVALVWPVLKWILSVDVFFQFLRMIIYWNDPSKNGVVTFLIHFAALTLLTWFVSRPK